MIRILFCSLLASFLASRSAASEDRRFLIENDLFLLDGKPFRILSGRCVRSFLIPNKTLSAVLDANLANQLMMLMQSALS